MQSSSLLQHLGHVGATGPHSGSKREYHSPLVRSSECARRQAHIAQQARSRGDDNDGLLDPCRPNMLLMDFKFAKLCAVSSKPVFWSLRTALARLLAGEGFVSPERCNLKAVQWETRSGSSTRYYLSEHLASTQHASASTHGPFGPNN